MIGFRNASRIHERRFAFVASLSRDGHQPPIVGRFCETPIAGIGV
jgi:hypothetical protein